MAILPILEIPDPILRDISAPVAPDDASLPQLIADMFETMYDAPGIGLAAIQIGVAKRVMVIDLQEEQDEDEKPIRQPRVFINPVISEPSEEVSAYNEGCLSIPEYYAEVIRPASVRAQWTDETGATHDERIDGMLATCVQHEMDHLNGVLFTDHLSKLKRDMALKKVLKGQRLRR
ncbi:peptide deformylase [Sphingomonas prati]|uniref:Peptide deformylase n=1 Tax=Sphingomonas prati TaxID=1843237 RepID=A0A7W9BR77_9SPHN|nr:peptide deformylase [Sphingomonas prati]MBB5728592.1 peptide deformylase [Sphingomonas prati]GGE72597.1 peptide deformylase [Sphingomonas prati]